MRELEGEGPRESSNLSHALKRKSTSVLMLVPRKLFVVCDYMMNDKNGDGVVAMDEVSRLGNPSEIIV